MSEWISVKDRLPIGLSTILIIDSLNEQYISLFDGNNFYQADYPNDILTSITHWQPLPAPPKD